MTFEVMSTFAVGEGWCEGEGRGRWYALLHYTPFENLRVGIHPIESGRIQWTCSRAYASQRAASLAW